MATQIFRVRNSSRTRAPCVGWSSVKKRTRILVSTAIMPGLQLFADGGIHFGERGWSLSFRFQAAEEFVDGGGGQGAGVAEEDTVRGLFDR